MAGKEIRVARMRRPLQNLSARRFQKKEYTENGKEKKEMK
jgi:hypothetical protein